ncbi:hypothetical protein GCM10009799_36010 [Nocardiopsis rhodophaea]|uniref:Secreted protein n=1 Tax=Nocardiopsis rhodophaea TaxID=280238 RepID=A0ABP5ETX1_9ACTN
MKKLSSIAAATCGVFGVIVLASPSANADVASNSDEPYCAILVGKASGDGPSPVIASACSPTSEKDARNRMMRAAERTQARTQGSESSTKLSSDLLMTWFEDANYGTPKADIYGDAGPCDSAGYELHPSTTWPWSWGNSISSAAGTETCDTADFVSQSNTYARTFNLPVPFIGNTLNDNVGTIRVWND